MPSSTSDFLAKVSAAVGTSGAIFKTATNADGSFQILRAPGSGSAALFTVFYARVIYDVSFDRVTLSTDGGGDMSATSSAAAFIAGLN